MKELGIGVATGEHCQNRVLFKQFITSGALQFCQIDACRLGGVNEVLAVMLIAAKYNGMRSYTQKLRKHYEGGGSSIKCVMGK